MGKKSQCLKGTSTQLSRRCRLGTGSNQAYPQHILLPHYSPGLVPLFREASKEVEENPDSHSLGHQRTRAYSVLPFSSISCCNKSLRLMKAFCFPGYALWFFQDQIPQMEATRQQQPSPGLLAIKGTSHLPTSRLFLMPAAIFNLLQIRH